MKLTKQEQYRNKRGLVAAKKLEAARDALHSYRMACIECGDLAAYHDRRQSLVGELVELAAFIECASKAGNSGDQL
jgi:hypothetical protein